MFRTDRVGRIGLSALVALGCTLVTHGALAYCVSTTCDPKSHDVCTKTGACITSGAELHWESRCLSFGVQKDGSKLRNISYELADGIIRTAFEQWANADCGGGQAPSFKMWDLGGKSGITCDEPQFNDTAPNANVWMFRDTTWPYNDPESTLALTSTFFDKNTGALLDADVEVNSFKEELTTTNDKSKIKEDFQSIATHEAGHFLGLAHSEQTAATMYKDYPPGDTNYRSLHADDVKAICYLYPKSRRSDVFAAEPAPRVLQVLRLEGRYRRGLRSSFHVGSSLWLGRYPHFARCGRDHSAKAPRSVRTSMIGEIECLFRSSG